MARRTTRKKGPSNTGQDTTGSDPSRTPDPDETAVSDTVDTSSDAETSPPDSAAGTTTPRPSEDRQAREVVQEAAIATPDESQLAKDISPSAIMPEAEPDAPVPAATAAGEKPDEESDAPLGLSETTPEEARADMTDTPAPADDNSLQSAPEETRNPEISETDRAPEGAPIAAAPELEGQEEARTTDSTDTDSGKNVAPPAAAPERKGGLFPLLLGGVLAGGIGYGAAYFGAPQAGDNGALEQLRSDVASLRSDLEAARAPVELGALEAEIATLRDQIAELPQTTETGEPVDLSAEVAELRALIAAGGGNDTGALQARLDDLDARLSQQADNMTQELDSLRAAVADAQSGISALGVDVADLRDLGERRVIAAEAAVDAALAQSGLDSLRAALETGVAYADAVARLEQAGVSVPEALAAPASTGVPTIEMLQDSFPQAARAALREALQGAPTESTADRLGNFLRAPTGARSTAPRAGDDPDAVLSRAGAAIEAGDLDTTLSEIDALPAPAQAAMGDWLGAARARLAARDALPELINTVTTE